MMGDIQIKLSFIWAALMLSYLLGDVLRLFAGDYKAGEIAGKKMGQGVWLGIAMLMVIPIVMIVLTMFLKQPVNHWMNIIAAAFFFVFNIIGLTSYPGDYDKFLNVFGLVMNIITIWLAWHWI
jgi:hypothetical protein